MKRFQITEAEYEAIKAKEAKTKDKNISRRLRVLMLRYEGKKLDEITKMTNLHRTSITQMCRRYREQGLEEYTRNKHQSHHWLLSWEQEEEILNQFNDGTGKQVILISIKNVFYPLALSNAHDGITRKVVDCLAETVYHLFQCSKYLIAKSSGS